MRGLDSAATEADTMLEGKLKGKKELSWKMVNIQHVTLNDMAQAAKLLISIGTKSGLVKKGHNLMDFNGLLSYKNEATAVSQYVVRRQRYRHVHCIPT